MTFILKKKKILKRIFILLIIFISSCIVLNVTSEGRILGRINHTVDEVNQMVEKKESETVTIQNKNIIYKFKIWIWKLYIRAFKDKPLMGTGPDTFK